MNTDCDGWKEPERNVDTSRNACIQTKERENEEKSLDNSANKPNPASIPSAKLDNIDKAA